MRFALGVTFTLTLLAFTSLCGIALAQQAAPPTALLAPVDPANAPNPCSAPGANSSETVLQVIVRGSRVRSLEQFTPTGSRLNLSAKDTPATLDVITSQTMTTKGYLTAEEAADSLPGVTSGGTLGDLVNFHIRGFTGDEI